MTKTVYCLIRYLAIINNLMLRTLLFFFFLAFTLLIKKATFQLITIIIVNKYLAFASLESGMFLLFVLEFVLLQHDRDEHLRLDEQVLGGVRFTDTGSNLSLTVCLIVNSR